jgi:hypothetical protein
MSRRRKKGIKELTTAINFFSDQVSPNAKLW